MRRDPGSHYTFSEVYAAASVGASTVTTSALNHANGSAASYLISCGTWDTSFVATLQHSADGTTDWTADDGTMGNDQTATLTEAGLGEIDVPNPTRQYSRLSIVLGGTCVFSVVAVLGPVRQKMPTDNS